MKEGSSADEPTNITLSDYSSDEGDTSSCSEDETLHLRQQSVEECCQPLPAPPPSPVLPHREHRKIASKNRSATESTTPPPQRKILQVNRTVIDLSSAADTGSDYCEPPTDMDSGEESSSLHNSLTRNKTSSDKKFVKYEEKRNMPPELIVTPAQFQISETQMAIDISEKLTVNDDQQAVGRRIYSYNWHHARCPPLLRTAAPINNGQNTAVDLANEVQVKLGTTLRQKLWTAVPCSCHGPLDSLWNRQKSTHEMLLRSCSKKLVALQKTGDVLLGHFRNSSFVTHHRQDVHQASASKRSHNSLKWKRYHKQTVVEESDAEKVYVQEVLQSGSDTEPGTSNQVDTAKKKKKKRKATHPKKGKRLQSACSRFSPKKTTKS